jgi:hypothetical protein
MSYKLYNGVDKYTNVMHNSYFFEKYIWPLVGFFTLDDLHIVVKVVKLSNIIVQIWIYPSPYSHWLQKLIQRFLYFKNKSG